MVTPDEEPSVGIIPIVWDGDQQLLQVKHLIESWQG